jgi:hypothetical protein
MSFSGPRWFVLAAADFAIRSVYMIVSTFNPLSLFIGFALSLIHLGLLIPVACLVSTSNLRPRSGFVVTLIVANGLFLCAFLFLWIWMIKAGQQTVCVGDECY